MGVCVMSRYIGRKLTIVERIRNNNSSMWSVAKLLTNQECGANELDNDEIIDLGHIFLDIASNQSSLCWELIPDKEEDSIKILEEKLSEAKFITSLIEKEIKELKEMEENKMKGEL
jgi:hypothetical protein